MKKNSQDAFVALFKKEETVPRANQSSRLDSQDPPEYQGKKEMKRNANAAQPNSKGAGYFFVRQSKSRGKR